MNKRSLKWIGMVKKTDRELPYEPPIWLGDMSNGEFYRPQTEHERKLRAEILRRCDDNARYVGMDRREFIASAMGMATTLSVINLASGCGNKRDGTVPLEMAEATRAGASGASVAGGGGLVAGSGGQPAATPPVAAPPQAGAGSGAVGGAAGPQPDGGFMVPAEACVDQELAGELLQGDEFILDLQTHHVDEGSRSAPVFVDCGLDPQAACAWPDKYVEFIFLGSDTTVAVLSGLPSPISGTTNDLTGFSNNSMMASRDRVNDAAASERMVAHCQVSPVQNWNEQAEMMERIYTTHGNRGWKCYPPTDGGWWLDEERAQPFIQKAKDLGEPLICAHKGFPLGGFDPVYCDPRDVGPAAVNWPDITFVIYHSAFSSGTTEGPYNSSPDSLEGGTDRLVKTVEDNGLYNKNVYAEMGSAWALAMRNPDSAQHYVGKMMKHIGEDRLVWGSECVWFGSPQPQIEAFRMFRISDEFQEMYGYPEMTPERRAKIFGLTAAKLYRIDPEACRYQVDASKLAQVRRQYDGEFGPRRWAFAKPAIHTRRQFLELWRQRNATGSWG